MDRRIWLVVFAVCVIWMFVLNPIRFNQAVHAGGLTMRVPVLWKPMKSPGAGMPIVLVREWQPFVPSGAVTVMDLTGDNSKTGREAQADVAGMPQRDSGFSNARTLDLKAGDRTAACVESTLNGSYHSLICYIVGTPLQFTFGGSRFSERAAERMLASLQ